MIKLHHHRATDDYHAKLVIMIFAAIRCTLRTDSNDLDDNTDIDVNPQCSLCQSHLLPLLGELVGPHQNHYLHLHHHYKQQNQLYICV